MNGDGSGRADLGSIAEPVAAEGKGSVVLAAILSGTFIGAIGNNIVNVPLAQIISYFDASLSEGVFVVTGFLIAIAAFMPIAGYLGDRFGRRRVYVTAVVGCAICAVGSATSSSILALIAWRSINGILAAPLAPVSIALITSVLDRSLRARSVSAWAAVNGVGQSVAPTMGGLIAGAWGWRWIFVPIVPMAIVSVVVALRRVPRQYPVRSHLDTWGAGLLTVGCLLVVAGVSLIAEPSILRWVIAVAVGGGVCVLVVFVWHCRRSRSPFVDLTLVGHSRFYRSVFTAVAQMSCFGTMMVAIPLKLHAMGLSPIRAGLIMFALPATMVLGAVAVGKFSDPVGPRRVIRAGLSVLVVGQGLLALCLGAADDPYVGLIIPLLALNGLGCAMVQSPATTGATRTAIGKTGSGLGLFQTLRFGGSALGGAWVAMALPQSGGYGLAFGAMGCVAALGLALSFLGTDPERDRNQLLVKGNR